MTIFLSWPPGLWRLVLSSASFLLRCFPAQQQPCSCTTRTTRTTLTAVSAQHLFILVVVEMLVLVEVVLGHLLSGRDVQHSRREEWLSPLQCCCVFCCNCVPVPQELRSAGRPYRRRTPAHFRNLNTPLKISSTSNLKSMLFLTYSLSSNLLIFLHGPAQRAGWTKSEINHALRAGQITSVKSLNYAMLTCNRQDDKILL